MSMKPEVEMGMNPRLNHFDEDGNAVMVDVSRKAPTSRIATAQGKIWVSDAVLDAIVGHTAAKGDVLGAAQIAGIMAAKRTAELIPLCHPLAMSHCSVTFTVLQDERAVLAECTAKINAKTGVEMEALTGVSVALLTIYDMCKAMDKTMKIGEIQLVYKEGGKSGLFRNTQRREPVLIAVSGWKNAGKTRLIVAMLPHLTAAGLKVATIKHDGHSFAPDPANTDTGKHMRAGACGAAVFDAQKYKFVQYGTLDEKALAARFPEADLVLLEGFKHSRWPKLEVIRGDTAPVCDPATLLALVSDQTDSVVTLPGVITIPPDGKTAARVVLDYVEQQGRLGRQGQLGQQESQEIQKRGTPL